MIMANFGRFHHASKFCTNQTYRPQLRHYWCCRAAPSSIPIAAGLSQPKRARRDRGLNWLPQEIYPLLAVKRDIYLEDFDTIDGRDFMTPDTSKWNRIFQIVMLAWFSPYLGDGPACKTKWNQLVLDYKRIADYLSRTGQNIPDYQELGSADRKAEGLHEYLSKMYTRPFTNGMAIGLIKIVNGGLIKFGV